MVKTTYCQAQEKDFFKFYGCAYNRKWEAMCLKLGDYVAGIGGYTLDEFNNCYVFIDIGSPLARSPILYRRAKRFLDDLSGRDIKKCLALCDTSKPNAERFLLRLGFRPTQQYQSDYRVWLKWLHC